MYRYYMCYIQRERERQTETGAETQREKNQVEVTPL